MMMCMLVVMVVMFVLVVVVMVVRVVMTTAVWIVAFLVVVPFLGHQLRHHIMFVGFHGLQDLFSGDLIPGGGDDDSVAVVRAQLCHGGGHLFLAHVLSAGEDDGVGMLDLVVEKLAEVLHIHFALGGVSHGDEAVQLHGCRFRGALYGADYVAEFAYAGRFDDHAVGMELLDDIVQRRAEIAHQGAADAPGIHFGNVDAGGLQKAAVNADFAELVFDQHHLLAFVGLFQQLFDSVVYLRPKSRK